MVLILRGGYDKEKILDKVFLPHYPQKTLRRSLGKHPLSPPWFVALLLFFSPAFMLIGKWGHTMVSVHVV